MTNETFEYDLKTARNFALMALCALAAVGAFYLTLTNEAGLTVAGFELGRLGATMAYGVVGLVAGFAAAQELRGSLRPKGKRVLIRLDDDGIVGPVSPSDPRMMKLTYKGISDIKPRLVDGERCLEIKHIEGNLRIAGAALGSKEAFDRLWKSLEARVGLHRGYRY